MKTVTRKSLSILLAILMLVGCISATIIPVSATSGTDDMIASGNFTDTLQPLLTALGNAINLAATSGAMDGATFTGFQDPTATGNQSFTVTINDNSPQGYILAASQAFRDILNTNFLVNTGGNVAAQDQFPFTWWTGLYRGLRDYYGYAAGSQQLHLLAALCHMKANNNATLTEKTAQNFLADALTNHAGNNNTTTFTMTLLVNRPELVAVRGATNYQAILDLKAAGPMPITYSVGLGASVRRGNSATTRHNSFNAFTAQPTTTTSIAQVDRLIAFHDYFLDGLLDTDPFNDYTFTQISALITAANSARTAVYAGGLTIADVDRIFGAGTDQAVQAFIAESVEARKLLEAEPSVRFFMDAADGFIALINSGAYLGMKLFDLNALYSKAMENYAVIDALSDSLKAEAVARYGLDVAKIDAAIPALKAQLNLLALERIKTGIDDFAPAFIAYKNAYTGPLPADPLDNPAWADYENYIEAYFAKFDASVINGMYNTTYGLIQQLNGYTAAELAASGVFPDGRAYADDFYIRLTEEWIRRNQGFVTSARSLHGFFNRVLADDLTALRTKDLVNRYNDAVGNQAAFYSAMNAARAQIGTAAMSQQGFDLTYTDFIPTVDAAMDKLGAVMLGRLEMLVGAAWDGLGDIDKVTYDNVPALRKVFYRLGKDGRDENLYNVLMASPYMSPALKASYELLKSTMLDEYNRFNANYGIEYHQQLTPEYMTRKAGNPYYNDLARAGAAEDYEVTNELLGDTVAKLDALLAGPAMGDLLGLDIGATLGGLFDGMWSDSMVNTIVLEFYKAVLDGLEDMFGDIAPPAPSTPPTPGTTTVAPGCSDPTLEACTVCILNGMCDCGCTLLRPGGMDPALTLPGYAMLSLHDILKGNVQAVARNANGVAAFEAINTPPTITKLALYPDLLATMLRDKYDEFDQVADVLEKATSAPSGSYYVYKTRAWEHPALYKPGSGDLNFDWGVDNPQPLNANGTENKMYKMESKEERFRYALGAALEGAWLLLAALICGQPIRVDHPGVAGIAFSVGIMGMANGYLRLTSLSLGLGVERPAYGYADLFTALFEGVFGMHHEDGYDTVPTLDELLEFAGPIDVVNAIFDPLLLYFSDILGKAPVAGILNLLPNLAYAMIMDRIVFALNQLDIDLNVWPDSEFALTNVTASTYVPNWNDSYNSLASIAGDIKQDINFPVMEQIESDTCDPNCLSYPDTACTCLMSGCLGTCFVGGGDCDECLTDGLDCLPVGEMVLYGQMTSGPSKRANITWTDYLPREVISSQPVYEDGDVETLLLDANGQPVPILGLDGNPLLDYSKKIGEKEVFKLDEFGEKIPVWKLDELGDPILDENDDPIQAEDEEGNLLFETVMEDIFDFLYQMTYIPGRVFVGNRDVVTIVYDAVPSRTDANNYHIDADEGDMLLFLMRYIFDALQNPAMGGAIAGLLGDGGIADIIAPLLAGLGGDNADDQIAAIVELFNPKESNFYAPKKIDWAYKTGNNPKVTYSDTWTKADAQFIADNFFEYVNDIIRFLGIYDENGKLFSIEGLLDDLLGGLNETIYSASLLNTIADLLADLPGLLGGLGLDGDMLDMIITLVDSELGVNLNAWDYLTEDYFSFPDGDRQAFVDGLCLLLRPIYPLLGFVLNSEDIELLGAIGAGGYAGYANGVIPLLEAFGAKAILTPAELEAALVQNPDAILTSILNPVLDVLDAVLADPITEVFNLLPNLLYFFESGGVQAAGLNVVQSVTVLIDTVRPLLGGLLDDLDLFSLIGGLLGDEPNEMLDMIFGLLDGLELSVDGVTDAVMGLLADMLGVNLTLPAGGIKFLLAGTVKKFTSRNGLEAYRLEGGGISADFITALQRFLIDLLRAPGNLAAVLDVVADMAGIDFLRQLDAILSALIGIGDTDRVMKTLLNVFYTVGSFSKAGANRIDRVNKNWLAICDALENSDLGLVSSFGAALRGFLAKRYNGLGTPNAARGIIPFIMRIIAWFQRVWNFVTAPWRWITGLFS